MTNSFLSALVNGAIVSALLAAAVRLGLLLAPRSILPASARYAVWWAVLAAAAVVPLAYLPARSAYDRPRLAAPLHATPAPAARSTPSPPAAIRQSTRTARLSLPLVITADGSSRWLPAAWAALSALFLIRLLASLYWLARRKRGAAPVPPELARRIDTTLIAHRSHRRVAVLASPSVAAPVLAGLRHPAVLIPERLLAKLSEPELISIALHEIAHLARRDDYALLAERLIQAVFPLHPVVWWTIRRISLEREIACDEFVVEAQGSPRRYAACLVRVMELCRGTRVSWVAAGMATGRSQFARRVDALLDTSRRPARRPARNLRLVAAAAIAAALAGLAIRTPRAIAFAMPPAPPQPQRAAPGPPPPPAAAQTPPASPKPARANPPLSVALIVDRSGSMRANDALVDIAVIALVKSANPADEFLVVTFNDSVDVAGAYSNDATTILGRLHRDTPRGGTSLRDAILRAAEWNGARYPNRRLVVISDGNDNSSSVSTVQLRAAVIPAGIPIWAITLASPAARPRSSSRWLEALVNDSHGREFTTDDPDEIAAVAARVLP